MLYREGHSFYQHIVPDGTSYLRSPASRLQPKAYSLALRPDNLNTQPGFFQREPREHLREKRKKTKYFDDFARPFALVARGCYALAFQAEIMSLRDNIILRGTLVLPTYCPYGTICLMPPAV